MQAATVLKAWGQGVWARRWYTSLLAAAVTVQRCWRATLEDKEKRTIFLEAVVAVGRDKAWWRMVEQMRNLRKTQRTVVVSQASLQRRSYLRLRAATLTLQTRLQAALARWGFLELRGAAVLVQGRWRAVQARREFPHQRRALVRRRREFLAVRQEALLAQSLRRGRRARAEYRGLREAAIVLQSRVRGWLARMQVA